MKGGRRLQGIVDASVSEIKAVRDFALEAGSYISNKKPKLPKVPFSVAELAEFDEIANAISSAVESVKSNGKGVAVRTDPSVRVSSFLMQILTPIKQSGFFAEMALVYLVSQVEAFVKDYLIEVLASNPIMLRSGSTITYQEVSAYGSIKSLQRGLAEKEVTSLTYKGIDDIAVFFEKRLNVNLCDFPNWNHLCENFYRRNLVVHNGARVDNIYRVKVKGTTRAGRVNTDMSYVSDAASTILSFAEYVHSHVLKK